MKRRIKKIFLFVLMALSWSTYLQGADFSLEDICPSSAFSYNKPLTEMLTRELNESRLVLPDGKKVRRLSVRYACTTDLGFDKAIAYLKKKGIQLAVPEKGKKGRFTFGSIGPWLVNVLDTYYDPLLLKEVAKPLVVFTRHLPAGDVERLKETEEAFPFPHEIPLPPLF